MSGIFHYEINPEAMGGEEKKSREAVYLELIYNSNEELLEMASNSDMAVFAQNLALKEIEYAIENNLEKVKLFNIFNLSIIINLKRKNFKDVLNFIIKTYEEIEDFETCIKIQKLIKKL